MFFNVWLVFHDNYNEFILTYGSVPLISMENHMIWFTLHNTALKILIEWDHGEMKFILRGWFHDRSFRKKAFIFGMAMLPETTLIGKYWNVLLINTCISSAMWLFWMTSALVILNYILFAFSSVSVWQTGRRVT